MARKNGLTRRQRSLINKQNHAEERRLLEEQWARIREAKLYPPPTSGLSPAPLPPPNARGRADAGPRAREGSNT